MYFIIGIWGGKRRIYAAMKFFLFTMAGSLLMFVAILFAANVHLQRTGLQSFSSSTDPRRRFGGVAPLPRGRGAPLLGLRARLPREGPASGPSTRGFPTRTSRPRRGARSILAGVLLKLGTYGFSGSPSRSSRLGGPVHPADRGAGPDRVVYGAWVAFAQKDMKKLVAYSSVSHLASSSSASSPARRWPSRAPSSRWSATASRPASLHARGRPLRPAAHPRDGRLRRHRGARPGDDDALPDQRLGSAGFRASTASSASS